MGKVLGLLLSGALALIGATPAFSCTIANWSGQSGDGLSAGSPADQHRRYRGECGLKVELGGAPSYVTDDSPQAEPSYLVRFYFFGGDLRLANGEWVDVFAAYAHESNTEPEFTLRLERTGKGRVFTARARDGGGFQSLDGVKLNPGWHAVEAHWQKAVGSANGTLELTVDGVRVGELTGLNNAGRDIDMVRLGAVQRAGAEGRLDFDAFVSHRATPVGILMKGDTTDDLQRNAADLVALVKELNGGAFVSGQPDCNTDGDVNQADLLCTANLIVEQ